MSAAPPQGLALRAAVARANFDATAWFPALDGLRCLAIVAVIWHHCLPRAWSGWLGRGHVGVPLFFSLSGFLITHVLLKEWRARADIALSWFWLRRALRIFPLYYLVLFGFALSLLAAGDNAATRHFYASLPFYLTYTATWFVDYGVSHPVWFGFAWSLAVEEQFYAFWPPLLRAGLRRAAWLPALLLVLLISFDYLAEAGSFSSWLPGQSQAHRIATSAAAGLLLGSLLAVACASRAGFAGVFAVLGARTAGLLSPSIIAGLVVYPLGPPILLDAAFTALVGASVVAPSALSRALSAALLVRVGRVSYGLYLLHVPVIGGLRRLWPWLIERPHVLFPVALALSYALAELSHRHLEAPLVALGRRLRARAPALACGVTLLVACAPASDEPARAVDVVDLSTLSGEDVRRVYGSTGSGSLGLAVAGGRDADGDGHADSAFAAMRASVEGVPGSGEVYLVFGDGLTTGELDTAQPHADILRITGDGAHANTGTELWLDDVTGDGLADLMIGIQNYAPAGSDGAPRVGAGALAIVVGSPRLRELSASLEALALASPPEGVVVSRLVGARAGDRLGIWMRSGDVTGDGVADVLVGADQESSVAPRAGAVYLIAGGAQLASGELIDLASAFETAQPSALDGYVARVLPPLDPEPARYHLGATCQLADLDGNGRAEVLAAAALNRAGAVLDSEGGLSAAGTGGAVGGHLFIAWDDNFPELPWARGFSFNFGAGLGRHTLLRGSVGNESFGEELMGGLDWDQDGKADLFVGDLAANLAGRPDSGSGHVIYDASQLAGLDTEINRLPTRSPPIRTTTIVGMAPGDISSDTAAQGDFSGDGQMDLVLCSPHAGPLRRHSAGAVHVLLGRAGGWPDRIDLRRPGAELGLLEVYGARGSFGIDRGDTLCYSAAWGDLDGDGLTDLISNEMVGNGVAPGNIDVGNLIVLSGSLLSGKKPQF